MKARINIKIFGDVHGVSFRFYTIQNSKKLGLRGFVRNIPDAVEIVAEGDKEKLLQLLAFCKKGPSKAKVENVEVEWDDYKGEFEGFGVEY